MCIDGDPRGGVDKISASSFAHDKDEDNAHLKEIFERFLTGGKGPNGMPDGSKVLERWNAQLAAEEAIKSWNTISDPALEKFMGDYMQKAWERVDPYNRGSIDILEATPFIRDLMQSMAPAPKDAVNEYEIDTVEEERKKWEKLDPVVEQDKAQEEDNSNPKKEVELNKNGKKAATKKEKKVEAEESSSKEDPLSDKSTDKEPKAEAAATPAGSEKVDKEKPTPEKLPPDDKAIKKDEKITTKDSN